MDDCRAESGKFEHVIWEGRYQPIHKGHLSYIAELLQYAEQVWVYVVDNQVSTEIEGFISPVPEFTHEVDKHHRAEKNPLPWWLRYEIVSETIKFEFGADAPITVWGGPRLDLTWKYSKQKLPPNRIFLTPERDDFEDIKAFSWRKLGEKVMRIDLSHLSEISATLVRVRLQNNEPIEDRVSRKTLALLAKYGYLRDTQLY